jgi:hypothetical protein
MLVSESSAMHQLRRRSAQKPRRDLITLSGRRQRHWHFPRNLKGSFFKRLAKPMVRPRANTEAPAWALRSPNSWWSSWRAKSGVESEPGKGSVFWFTVQLEKQAGDATSPGGRRRDLSDLRFLAVDDNAANRRILSHQLGAWQMRADSAAICSSKEPSFSASVCSVDLCAKFTKMPLNYAVGFRCECLQIGIGA